MSRAEMDELCEKLFAVAEDGLESDGAFPPVCATLDEQGQVQVYAADEDEVPDFQDQLEVLKALLKETALSQPIRAVGFCSDAILHRTGKPKQDAIHCCLEHADGTTAARFKPYSKSESGAIDYGQPFSFPHEREVLGLTGMTLSVENRKAISFPTPGQIVLAVDTLTPRGGPGFIVLDGPSDDYCQAAGGDGRLTVEWRQYSDGTFTHWVAGLPPKIDERSVKIQTNGAEVTVRRNEVLSADDVKQILLAFGNGQDRPGSYVWRDATAKYV